MKSSVFFGALMLVSGTYARKSNKRDTVSVYGQCGGASFTGPTACAPGSTCVSQNNWYSQCLPGSANVATSSTTPKTTSTSIKLNPPVPATTSASGLKTTQPASTAQPATTTKPVTTAKPATTASTTTTSSPQPTSPASSGLTVLGPEVSAIGTFYGGNWNGGACGLTDYHPAGMPSIALGSDYWSTAAHCGDCVEITGKAGTMVAMIVDECPECTKGHLDLEEAYASRVDGPGYATDGIFNLKWKFVSCPVSNNVQFRIKEGSSAYWLAVQVRNIKFPIAKVEMRASGSSAWTQVARQDYNYFLAPSGVGSVFDIQVTSTQGTTVVQKGIAVQAGAVINGSGQL